MAPSDFLSEWRRDFDALRDWMSSQPNRKIIPETFLAQKNDTSVTILPLHVLWFCLLTLRAFPFAGEGGLVEGGAVAGDSGVAGFLQDFHQASGQLLPDGFVVFFSGDILCLVRVGSQVEEFFLGASAKGDIEEATAF